MYKNEILLSSLSKKRNVIKESGFNLEKYTKNENISKLKKYTFVKLVTVTDTLEWQQVIHQRTLETEI